MSKKEKYINFIIDDLVSKTEIDYEQETIFLTHPSYPSHLLHFPLPSYLPPFFTEHVTKLYGTHKDEVDIIWYQYKQRIKELVSNE
tara:strand:- start:664 stop:921 length:258 start_codon:yes stop_codon:yes gene_type:complete